MVQMASPWKNPKTGTYYIRRAVPADLRDTLGWEYKRPLGTNGAREAKRLFAEAFEKSDRVFEIARGEFELSAKDAVALAGKWLMDSLDDIADGSDDPDQVWAGRSAVIDALEAGDTSWVEPHVEQLIEEEGLPIQSGSAIHGKLVAQMGRALVTGLSIAEKRARGDWSEDAELKRYPEWRSPVAQSGHAAGGNECLSDLYEAWKKEEQPSPRRVMEQDGALQRFYDMRGDMKVSEIERDHMRQLKDKLVNQWLVPTTINKQLTLIRTPLRYALDNGYIAANPGAGINVRGAKKRAEERLTYSVDDHDVIFSGPVHKDGDRPKGGAGEAAYWLPLIALYHGMRLREIGQLATADLKCEGEVWYFDVTNIGDDDSNSVKTKGSRRRVPVHPTVIELGLLEYVQVLPAGGMFPDLKTDKQGNPVKAFGQWYGRYARGLGISDKRKVFHSFRHNFKDACRAAGIT